MLSTENIERIADQLRAASRMHIRDGKGIPPTAFIVARDNPVTGEPAKASAPVIPIVQPNTLSKDAFASCVRSVAVAARAQAVIFCADVWHVRVQDESLLGLTEEEKKARRDAIVQAVGAPSQHEDRVEAIVVVIEYDDGRVTRTHQPYTRDQGRILFENVERMDVTQADQSGRFTFLVSSTAGRPPDEIMGVARNISAYICEGVDWIPAAWEAVAPGEEEAQVARG